MKIEIPNVSRLHKNMELSASARDESNGGGSREYIVYHRPDENQTTGLTHILFQRGPVAEEADINGITDEMLLLVVRDRLQCFQKGKFSCRENAIALTKIEEAIQWLMWRSLDRESRGVEGKLER